MLTIAHLTSAHDRYDTRIFVKMCTSLAKKGHCVYLIVADDLSDEQKNAVTIISVGKYAGRLGRMLKATRKVYEEAKKLDCDVYHLHDPELIPVGLKLKKMGKMVIFDSHEDVPQQMLGKQYIHPLVRKVLSRVFQIYERITCSKFDAIVTATPLINRKFLQINSQSVNINNFPILGELAVTDNNSLKDMAICYVGNIAEIRGIREIIKAMALTKTVRQLNLAGRFDDVKLEEEMRRNDGWQAVNSLGFLDREGIKSVLNTSLAGLVTLRPAVNYLESLPVKMFEYMSAGIPVIASNFPYWEDIILKNHCGLCVDPLNPAAIAEAIDYLGENPDLAKEMGQNGQQAIYAQYNWTIEEKKLLELYERLGAK